MKKFSAYIHLLRIPHWIKNVFLFAAILFAGKFMDIRRLQDVLTGFFLFCLASSSAYIFNDVMDRKSDKEHPDKSRRPIAMGLIPVSQAIAFSGILSIVAVTGAFFLSKGFTYTLVGYLALNLCYSLALKHVVIIDIFVIALGFVLRLIAGGYAADLPISAWAILCTIFLSLFLGFGKRRHEIIFLKKGPDTHRKVLAEYSVQFLDRMIGVVTACTVMSYTLYTVETAPHLIFTSIFVLYGIFRYLYLVYQKGEGGSPTNIVLTDLPLIIDVFFWALISGIIIYGHSP